MKTRLKLNWLIVMVMALTSLLPTARAFYAPSEQRWLNRDPLNEQGFEAFRNAQLAELLPYLQLAESLQGANLFTFNLGDPINHIDPEGLQICPVGLCIPVPCPPGTFVFCVFRCATGGQGVPIGPPLCLVCFSSTGVTSWVGCPCSGVFKPRRRSGS